MLLHPPLVHFAIALPVVASVFGLLYLFKRSEGLSKISARLTLFAAIAIGAAWYTGSKAGPQIYDYLSSAGQHELLEHKELGLYLAIAFAIIAVLQVLGCRLKKFPLEALAIIILFGATATVFLQGKDGGEIVYKYGQPFKAPMILQGITEAQSSADDEEECDAQVELYSDAVDDALSVSEEVQAIYAEPEAHADDDEEDED